MASDMTMINGRIVWQKGEFPGLDEAKLAADAEAALSTVEF
jgi:hydroxyatrazine ethylaminohydrolase